jgi:hypothetical protein
MNLKTLLVLLVMSIMAAWLAPELTKLASDQKNVTNMSYDNNNKFTTEKYNKVRAANKNHRVADYVRSKKQDVAIEKNSSLLGIVIAMLLLFIVIGLPALLWKNKVNNAVRSKKNKNHNNQNIKINSNIGTIYMALSKIKSENDIEEINKYSEIIEKRLEEISTISSSLVSSQYNKVELKNLCDILIKNTSIPLKYKDNVTISPQLSESSIEIQNSALDALTQIVNCVSDYSDNNSPHCISIKIHKPLFGRLNKLLSQSDAWLPIAIKITITCKSMTENSQKFENKYSDDLLHAQEYIEQDHCGKFKYSSKNPGVEITLPIKKIENC